MDELTSQKGELTRLVDELTRLFDELTRHFDQFTSPLRRPLPGPAGCLHAARCRFEDQREGGEAGGGGTHRRSAGGRRRAACGGGVHQRAGRGRQQHTSTRRQRSCSACTCNVGAPCTTGWGSASEAEPTRAQCEAGRQASWQAGRRAGMHAGGHAASLYNTWWRGGEESVWRHQACASASQPANRSVSCSCTAPVLYLGGRMRPRFSPKRLATP